MGPLMHWYTRFWERFAIGILVRSSNISMLAFKDRELDQVIMAGSIDDPAAMAFIDANTPDDENYTDPDSLMLERLFHAPDGEKPN
jgi:hypothetical protein